VPRLSGRYSAENPYPCSGGKHFSSEPPNGPCLLCVAKESQVCCSGRHYYKNPITASVSACCREFRIHLPPLELEKAYNENQLAGLEGPIRESASKIEKFKAQKQRIEEEILAKQNARAEALGRGEDVPADPDLLGGPGDLRVIERHMAREQQVLSGLTLQRSKFQGRLAWILGRLKLAEKLKARDEIYGRMTAAMLEWNKGIQALVKLRREANVSIDRHDLNEGYIPLMPPGIVGGPTPDSPRGFFCLDVRMTATQDQILAWKAPDTD